MKIIFVTVLCLLATSLIAAEEVDLPRSVERAQDRYDETVDEAEKAYEEAVAAAEEVKKEDLKEAGERCSRVLDREMQEATKDGNLDLAIALRDKKEEVSGENEEEGGEGEEDGDELTKEYKRKMINIISGEWQWNSGIKFMINEDGTVIGNNEGSVEVTGINEIKITVGRWIHNMSLLSKNKMEGQRHDGMNLTARKID